MEAAEKNLRMPKLFTSDAELGDVDDTCIIIYLLILSHIIASFDKQTLMPKRAQTCIPSSSSTSSSSLSTFSSSSSSLASSALTVVLSMTFRSFGEDFPKSKKLTVSRSLTGEEVYRLIAEKMKIPDPGDFSCFEMKSDNDGKFFFIHSISTLTHSFFLVLPVLPVLLTPFFSPRTQYLTFQGMGSLSPLTKIRKR